MKSLLGIGLLFTSIVLHAQVIVGKIISKKNNQPIAYARIGIVDETFGTTSDKDGVYSIDLTNISKDKSLTVQFGGYVPMEQKVGDFIQMTNHDIALVKKETELEEVVIQSENNYISKNWGINSKGRSLSINVNSEKDTKDSSKEIAVVFPNKKRVKIMKINLNISSFNAADTLFLNFDVYSKIDKWPDSSLLAENVTDTLTIDKIKDGTFSVDVSGKHIWIKRQDFFVSAKVLNNGQHGLFLNAALLKSCYYRNFFGSWKKLSIAGPAINIDVKVEK